MFLSLFPKELSLLLAIVAQLLFCPSVTLACPLITESPQAENVNLHDSGEATTENHTHSTPRSDRQNITVDRRITRASSPNPTLLLAVATLTLPPKLNLCPRSRVAIARPQPAPDVSRTLPLLC